MPRAPIAMIARIVARERYTKPKTDIATRCNDMARTAGKRTNATSKWKTFADAAAAIMTVITITIMTSTEVA